MSPSEKTQPRPGAPVAAGRAAPSGGSAGASPGAVREAPHVGAPHAAATADHPSLQGAGASSPTAGARAPQREPERPTHEAAGAPRKVRLTVARFNPWSVAKLAFLLSVALGVAGVVAVAILWSVLDGMGVFSSLSGVIRSVVGTENPFDLMDYVGLSRVLSVAITLGVVDVVLITVIATLASVLYNLSSSLVGGVRLTLSDD